MATAVQKIKQIDPVCGMEVDPDKAAATTCYKGKMVFFCAEGCKKAFEKNPKAYSVGQKKGIWKRYLDRLNKATGGQAMSCH